MHAGVDLWAASTRRRLVALCGAITHDHQAAEDLAQETLLEAWRNAHKLHDPSGGERWLAAIARNVCLRWGRRSGRDLTSVALLDEAVAAAEHVELETDLDRAELAGLLDRALAELPEDTRDVLVRRYVDELTPAEIAQALGISVDAVSMRLTRGKAALRRILASELRDEAQAHGLGGADWAPTRVWCSECGARKLLVRRSGGTLAFRCAGCTADASATGPRVRPRQPVLRVAPRRPRPAHRGAGARHRLVGPVLRGRRTGGVHALRCTGACAPVRACRQDHAAPGATRPVRGVRTLRRGRLLVGRGARARAARGEAVPPRPPTRPRGSGGRGGSARSPGAGDPASGRPRPRAARRRPRAGHAPRPRRAPNSRVDRTHRDAVAAAPARLRAALDRRVHLGRRRPRAARCAAVLRLRAHRLHGRHRRDDRRRARARHPARVVRRCLRGSLGPEAAARRGQPPAGRGSRPPAAHR